MLWAVRRVGGGGVRELVARKTGGSETPPLRSGWGVRRRWDAGWCELGGRTSGRRAGRRRRPYERLDGACGEVGRRCV